MQDVNDTKSWSANFQRLRAETFVLALIILAITRLDVNLSRVPVVGLEIAHPVSKGALIGFLYVIAVYFLVSWQVRYTRELKDLEDEISIFSGLLYRLDQLPGRFRIDEGAAHTHAQWELEKFKGDLKGTLESLLDYGQLLMEQAIRDASAEDNKKVGKMEPSYFSRRVANAHANAQSAQQQAFETFIKIVEEKQEALNATTLHVTKQMREAYDEFSVEIDRVRSNLIAARRGINLDRRMLSHWVPLLFTMAILLYSTPQATVDVLDSGAAFMRCEKCSFFFRSQSQEVNELHSE